MIFIVSNNTNVREKNKNLFALKRSNIFYSISETEYCFSDKHRLVFLSSNIDKTREQFVEENIKNFDNFIRNNDFHKIENLFNGNYFIIYVDILKENIYLFRDKTGVKTGYFGINNNSFCISTNVHNVAKKLEIRSFNDEGIYQLLYTNFLFDGVTIYDSVSEVRMGECLKFDKNFKKERLYKAEIVLHSYDNNDSDSDNIKNLRNEIINAHRKFLSEENIVLLSGGIDSVAMLAALNEIHNDKKLENISFRVKGTTEDETGFAKKSADFLYIPIRIFEIDPNNNEIFKNFEEKVLKMNNPYIGVWVFGNLIGNPNKVFYAGQDTRLHTPALNIVDKIIFGLLPLLRINVFRKIFKIISKIVYSLFRYFKITKAKPNAIKGIVRFFEGLDFEKYLYKYTFGINTDFLKSMSILSVYLSKLQNLLSIDISSCKTARQLYNEIVKKRWQMQYISDIRYLQDMAEINSTYIAMPFYDYDLALFSSGLPFSKASKLFIGKSKFSNRKELINKFFLRNAIRKDVPDEIFFRQKAVSSTIYLLFNGVLGDKVRNIINNDVNSNRSFIKEYNIETFVKKFQQNNKWTIDDELYLLKVYYISTLCIYFKKMLNAN